MILCRRNSESTRSQSERLINHLALAEDYLIHFYSIEADDLFTNGRSTVRGLLRAGLNKSAIKINIKYNFEETLLI